MSQNSSPLNLSYPEDLNLHWEYCKDITSVFLACELTALDLAFLIHGYTLWLITDSAFIATEILIFYMAILEIVHNLFIPLADAVYLITTYQNHFTVITYTASLLLFSRPVFQCCICVERYLAVVHPVVFLKYKPLRYKVGWATGAWWVTLTFTGMSVSLYAPQFPIHCFLTYILLFLFVDLFCSLFILRVLKRPKLGQGEMERRGEGEKEKEGMNAMKKKVFTVVSVVMAMIAGSTGVLPQLDRRSSLLQPALQALSPHAGSLGFHAPTDLPSAHVSAGSPRWDDSWLP